MQMKKLTVKKGYSSLNLPVISIFLSNAGSLEGGNMIAAIDAMCWAT